MKQVVSTMLSVALALALTACGSAQTTDETTTAEDVTSTTSDASVGDTADNNILVAYFSLAGEQYGVGVIEEGNTSIIAHMIAEETGADLFEIEPVTPYPETYDELLEVSEEERDQNARPEIADTVQNMETYDTVFIGYPIWWGDMPMIVYHFLESYDFSGKTVIPFCTNAGSGLADTEQTIQDLTGADLLDGFAIAGETAQNDRESAREQVEEWLTEIGITQ